MARKETYLMTPNRLLMIHWHVGGQFVDAWKHDVEDLQGKEPCHLEVMLLHGGVVAFHALDEGLHLADLGA